MRTSRSAAQWAGALALLASLLLSGPGVRAVRAQEAAAPAPLCSVEASAVTASEFDAEGRQVVQLRAKPEPAEDVVVLNTRNNRNPPPSGGAGSGWSP